MTLGVFIEWGNVPILISDMFISGVDYGAKTYEHDKFFSEIYSAFGDAGTWFSGLARKLVDLSPNCIYTFSGSVVEATLFEREVRTKFPNQRIRPSEMRNFMCSYPKEDSKNLQIIALVATNNGFVPLTLNTVVFEDYLGHRMAIIGSGTEEFFSYSEFMKQSFINPFSPAAFAMVLAGLYHQNILWGAGQARGWGVGFEARYLKDRKFIPLDRVYSSVWRWTKNPDGSAIDVIRISDFFNFYVDELAGFFCNGNPIGGRPLTSVDHKNIASGQVPDQPSINIAPQYAIFGFQIENSPLFWLSGADHVTGAKYTISRSDSDTILFNPDQKQFQLACDSFVNDSFDELRDKFGNLVNRRKVH